MQRPVAVLVALGLTLRCGDVAAELPGVYSGCYVAGFEVSVLRPAGTTEDWWVEWRTDTTMMDTDRRLVSGKGRSSQLRAFVEVHGKLSEEGRYGHMGMYKRELIVSKLVSARSGKGRCGS